MYRTSVLEVEAVLSANRFLEGMPKRPLSWPQIDLADTNTPQPLSQPLRPLNLSCHKAQEHILSCILNLGVGQFLFTPQMLQANVYNLFLWCYQLNVFGFKFVYLVHK